MPTRVGHRRGMEDRDPVDRTDRVARLLAVHQVVRISAGPTQVARSATSDVIRVRVTGVTRVGQVTGVVRVTGMTATGARVRTMHSGAGATRRGVTDPRHGAGE